jgi:hypothetical protein
MKKEMRTAVEKVWDPRKRWWAEKLLFPVEIDSRIEDLFRYSVGHIKFHGLEYVQD